MHACESALNVRDMTHLPWPFQVTHNCQQLSTPSHCHCDLQTIQFMNASQTLVSGNQGICAHPQLEQLVYKVFPCSSSTFRNQYMGNHSMEQSLLCSADRGSGHCWSWLSFPHNNVTCTRANIRTLPQKSSRSSCTHKCSFIYSYTGATIHMWMVARERQRWSGVTCM